MIEQLITHHTEGAALALVRVITGEATTAPRTVHYSTELARA